VAKQRAALQAKEDSAAPAAAKAVVERPAVARAPSGKSLTALLHSRCFHTQPPSKHSPNEHTFAMTP